MGYSNDLYEARSNTEEDEALLEPDREALHRLGGPRLYLWIFWLLSVVFTYAIALLSHPCKGNLVQLTEALEGYSPLHKTIRLRTEDRTLVTALWGDASNVWRQDPSLETDERWDSLYDHSLILISREEVLQLGHNPASTVSWPEDTSGNTFVAGLDVWHLLHCLNVLRKAAYFDHYQKVKPINPAYWPHMHHCLEKLRQELLCTASLHVYPIVWQEHQEVPYPNFEINRKCRNLEDIRDWQARRWVNETLVQSLRKPEGDLEHKTPEEGIKLMNDVGEWKEYWRAKGKIFQV